MFVGVNGMMWVIVGYKSVNKTYIEYIAHIYGIGGGCAKN
jgi:hypothetical protein